MTSSQPTPDETLRIEALRQYAVLDTLPEQALDDLTALAAKICGAPMAAISLVDKDRQWFKARVGMEMAETPRDVSFCGHAVHQRDLFIVPDATLDERFGDNPLVIGSPGIRFYAGAPLVTPSDLALGALCVMDHVPRILTQWQEDALRILGRQVMTHLELHRHTHKLIESEKRLQIVTENARVGLVIVNEDRRYVYANKAYTDILDLSSSLIVGQRVSEVLAGVYDEQVRPRLDRAFAGERVAYDLRKPGAGGERYYEVRYEPSTVEGVVAMVVVVITDVTERKQGELALLHVAAIVESSDDAIIGKDLNSIITSWNKGAEKVFGYTSAEMVGTSIMRLIPVDRQDEENLILTEIKSGESVKHFETLRQTKDGRLINVSVTASPIKDATGKPIGVSKVARDITDRKQAETELRESQATMASALASMTDAVFISDSTGQFINFNDAFASFHRFKDKSECARKLSDYQKILDVFMPNGELAPPDMWAVSRALRGETVTNAEYILRRKDTGETWIGSYSFSPIRNKDGLIIGSVTIGRDITERKKAEEQIAEQAALLDKAQDAILVRDLEGKILFWNKGAERMYGWAPEEVVGRDIGGLLYTDPHKFEEVNGLAISQGEWHGDLQHLTKNRGEITIEARWTLIRDNEGQPKSVLAINTDVTDKKKIEAQFMRAQRMESIGTLAGGVAHDLNNILAPIMMSIDILKTFSNDPQAQAILETIEVSAKRGADIVSQVLSFARGLEGERIEVQPTHLLKDLENIIKDTFPKDIRLQFSAPDDTWTILGDPTQVHQILLNLCVNARDAMPNGGRLTIGIENFVLDEQYAAMNIQAKPGRYVNISVTDSGTGMPPDLIEKIFEPFFTTKDLNKGTGLGLSTVIAIVKSHEGVINVYSEPGKGTTFNVYLPAMETSSESRKEHAEAASLPRGNDETILVIDDEASILTITSQTLQAFGYRVLTAMDGADALSVYVQNRNDIAVVLTDMMMPVLDGPATIHALRRINPAVKIIAASGLITNGGVAKASSAGIKHFLTKPYTAGTLLKAIRAILNET
jgi:PAS domain S-box-containing protein